MLYVLYVQKDLENICHMFQVLWLNGIYFQLKIFSKIKSYHFYNCFCLPVAMFMYISLQNLIADVKRMLVLFMTHLF